MTTTWRPLPERLGLVPPVDVLHEELSPGLTTAVVGWLHGNLRPDFVTQLCLRLDLPVPELSRDDGGKAAARNVVLTVAAHQRVLLAAVDAVLDLRTQPTSLVYRPTLPSPPDALEALLRDGRSAWRVDEAGTGLERRVDPTGGAGGWRTPPASAASGAAAVAAAGAGRSSAAVHLQAAWDAAHRLDPDPGKAYSEAVKSVEAASIPVVLPTSRDATLGTVLRHLRDAGSVWELDMRDREGRGDVEPLIAMLALLWTRQTDRHGGGEQVPVTPAAAGMAVHLAVTLVQWFSGGHVRKRL